MTSLLKGSPLQLRSTLFLCCSLSEAEVSSVVIRSDEGFTLEMSALETVYYPISCSFCRSSVHPFVYLCFLCCSICLIYFPFYSIFLSKFPIYFILRVILFVSPTCLPVAMAGGPLLVFLSTCLVFTFLAIFVSLEVSSSFRPDQYSVVTGSKDCSMKIWSLSNGKLSSCLLGCNALTSRCACVVKRDS